jgi:hypothetical protein
MQDAKYKCSKVNITKLWPNSGFVLLLHIYIKINDIHCIKIHSFKHYFLYFAPSRTT